VVRGLVRPVAPVALLRVAFTAAVIAGGPVSVSGQVDIRSDVDTTLVTVGDRITLTVRVTHPAGASVAWPDSLNLSPFEVLGAQALPIQSEGDARVSSATFLLTAFELGEVEIPSFDVDLIGADGRRETLRTDGFGVEVVSVGQDETGDIREIRGPLMIPVSVLRVAGWLVALLMAVVAGAWGYRRWAQTRVGEEVVETGPPPRPPHEIALEALDRLEHSEMLMRGQVKEYHIEASDILRRYIEARFRVTALELTTWEILDSLTRAGAAQDVRDDVRRFLDQCDLVKFAKVRPSSDASREMVQLGRALVTGSMSRVPEEPTPFSAGSDSGEGWVEEASS
jgi:hypothetical protein